MLEYSRKKYIFAFLFYAIYSSIIVGTVFLVNDYLDEYFNKDDNKLKKTGLHIIITFFITFFLLLVFWFLFGWGLGWTPVK